MEGKLLKGVHHLRKVKTLPHYIENPQNNIDWNWALGRMPGEKDVYSIG